jgi:hypothetical protein
LWLVEPAQKEIHGLMMPHCFDISACVADLALALVNFTLGF